MKIWLILLARSPKKGFTLLELLLASIMTFFVVSATGYAILVMTRESLTNKVSSDTQFNLNRAMDFVADEAKSASSVYTSASDATTAATDFDLPAGATTVLGLNIVGAAQPTIYYVKPRQSGDVWLGPNIIYRWGPTLDSNGAYTDLATPSTWGVATSGGKRQGIALVDAIADSSYYIRNESGVDKRIALTGIKEVGPDQNAATDNINKCPAGGASSDIASGWTAIPGIVSGTTYLGETTGFFVCVSNDGRQVEIHAYASLADELQSAGSTDSRGFDKASYGVVTQVFARSATP